MSRAAAAAGGAAARGDAIDPPGRAGYVWPAEWAPHRATWLAWPHNRDTWPSGLGPVEDAYTEMVRALVPGEAVEILVQDEAAAERVRARLVGAGVAAAADASRVRMHAVPTDDAWIRDHGALVVCREAPRTCEALGDSPPRVAVDFAFDAWGRKYPPWERDDRVGAAMAARLALPRWASDVVMEGGALDGDGEGTLLTSEACLLHPNRMRPGHDRSRAGLERLLADALGAKAVLWLGEGIVGDDTDGHVDDMTRFVGPGRVVTAVESDRTDPNFAPLAENRRRLEGMRDASGRRLEVLELPMPEPLEVAGGERLPASYANFLIANAGVLVPVFGGDRDREALAVLERCLPDRPILPIPAQALVEGLGAVHCLTQQEPAAPAD